MTTTPQTDGHWPNGVKVAEFNNRTVIACECGDKPKAPASRMSMQHVWHAGHRRKLGLQPVDYAWPDDSYLVGLSTGTYQQMRGHEWRNGGWVRICPDCGQPYLTNPQCLTCTERIG